MDKDHPPRKSLYIFKVKTSSFFYLAIQILKDDLTSSASKNIVKLTELIKDYVATELLSSIELDFLEGELWETTQHIAEINTVIKAPKLSLIHI